ncbi:MAG: RDD family protein [Planctomycetota bacterium]
MSAVALRRAEIREARVVTPEGVPLQFEIAPAGSRLYAFTIDFLILAAVVFVFAVGVVLSGMYIGGWALAAMTVLWFLLMNFWFIYFEVSWHGRTVGKRMARIRVIDSKGGELTAAAVFARNFMREIELWLPMKVILFGSAIYGDLPGWAMPLCVLWAIVLVLIPAFNRDRLRLGDMVGGTLVVRDPKTRLLPDLVDDAKRREEYQPTYRFTREQLDIYGIYELQVLEDLLRQGVKAEKSSLEIVAQKIASKIKWRSPSRQVDTRTFLDDFYRAQRVRLEKKALFGDRQEFKRGYEE